jgi:hypothetical protein
MKLEIHTDNSNSNTNNYNTSYQIIINNKIKIQMNSNDLKEFEENIDLFLLKYSNNNIPPYVLMSLLLNSSIGLTQMSIIINISTIIKNKFSDNIHSILTLTDSSGFSVLSSVLSEGDLKILHIVEDLISTINYPIQKIDCLENEINNFDTFISCPQFDNLSVNWIIETLIKPFYTEKSIGKILILDDSI